MCVSAACSSYLPFFGLIFQCRCLLRCLVWFDSLLYIVLFKFSADSELVEVTDRSGEHSNSLLQFDVIRDSG